MRLRNVIREDIRRSVARKMPHLDNAGSDVYDTVELTPEVIDELESARPDRHAIKVMPHKKGGGIEAATQLLRTAHPNKGSTVSSTGAHSFEMLNVNEEITFQFVMSDSHFESLIKRQLETFYPDSNVERSELTQPDLLPLYEGWHFGMCHLGLKLDSTAKERLFPWKHIDVEGFDIDPMGAITREMVGELESPDVTNVAVQTMFQPAGEDWYKGGMVDPSIEKAARALDKKVASDSGASLGDFLDTFRTKKTIFDVAQDARQNKVPESDAGNAVRAQRGHPGFELNVRIMGVGENPEEVVQRVDDTANMFLGYYDSDTEQGFETVPLKEQALLEEVQHAYRRLLDDHGIRAGERGAASLVHLPNKGSNTQNVTFSHTSNAGDVPPDHPRFADFDKTGWEPEDRSVTMNPDEWNYAITQRQPTQGELERAAELEEEEQREEAI